MCMISCCVLHLVSYQDPCPACSSLCHLLVPHLACNLVRKIPPRVCSTLGCVERSCSDAVCVLFVSRFGVVGSTLGGVRIGVAFIWLLVFVAAALAKIVLRRLRASRSSLHMLIGV